MPARPQVLGVGLPPALRALLERRQTQRARTGADRSLARRLRADVGAPGGLALYVHDGAVSVYGAVPDAAARDAVIATASAVPGVRRVVDHLLVGGG